MRRDMERALLIAHEERMRRPVKELFSLNKMASAVCLNCGISFIARRRAGAADQKHCSTQCQRKYQWAQRKARKAK